MASEPVRAGADWLALREPADAAARAVDLADALLPLLPASRPLRVHDLGSGTGSMARWLAPRLPGPQHWVLHDRDDDLLARAAAYEPPVAADGAPVTVETRHSDVTRLELPDADLLTASALLDMMTGQDLERFVAGCARASCPSLVTLSVVGRVDLEPADPLDVPVRDAFNAHQRRTLGEHALLGPDAAALAVTLFREHGHDVAVRPSPWRLGPEAADLAVEWLTGWVSAAVEQRPDLWPEIGAYTDRRLAHARSGNLSVTVHHEDLLSVPGG